MRVIRDGFAHIDKNGERLHTKVRVLQSDDHRVAVFLSPHAGPAYVYDMAEVGLVKTSASCSHPVCYGKATRNQLTRLWEKHEAGVSVAR